MLATRRKVIREKNSLSDTSRADENVDGTKVGVGVLDGVLNGSTVTDVNLVEANVDAGLFGELPGSQVASLLLDVEDGNTANTDFGKSLSHVESQTTSTTVKKKNVSKH